MDDNIISFAKVIEHERLMERLTALRDLVATAYREAPERVASPVLVHAAATLVTDIYRLVSREPGARALQRFDRQDRTSHGDLVARLRDARLVLDAFAWNHRDHDEEYGDEWLTIEGIEYFHQSRGRLIPGD